MGQAILFAVGSGVLGALALSVALKILILLPFAFTVIDLIVVAGGMAGVGYGIGEAVRYGSGKKLDRRLKYVVAGGVFVTWIVTIALLPVFDVPNGIMAGLSGIIGLIAAFYVATSRVRI